MGSIPLGANKIFAKEINILLVCQKCGKNFLPDRESNPGLPRDRRRSLPLDYRGFVGKGAVQRRCEDNYLLSLQ